MQVCEELATIQVAPYPLGQVIINSRFVPTLGARKALPRRMTNIAVLHIQFESLYRLGHRHVSPSNCRYNSTLAIAHPPKDNARKRTSNPQRCLQDQLISVRDMKTIPSGLSRTDHLCHPSGRLLRIMKSVATRQHQEHDVFLTVIIFCLNSEPYNRRKAYSGRQ